MPKLAPSILSADFARLGEQIKEAEAAGGQFFLREVGNLAAIYPGAVRWLFVALTVKLFDEGYEWVVFTGTPVLRNVLHKLELDAVEIGPAKPERLAAEDRASWGTYYDTQPMVMTGSVRDALQVISSNASLLLLSANEKQAR